MFAFLFSEAMAPFWANVLSFPTVVFSVGLVLCLVFWAISSLGVLDIDSVDLDVDGTEGSANALAALLVRTGLNGVPVTVVLTLLMLFGWLISYFVVDFAEALLPDGGLFRFLFGLPVFIATLGGAVAVTRFALRPFKRLFSREGEVRARDMLGKIAVVRTTRVDGGFGEAKLEDGGAGLVLKVRAAGEATHGLGDRVVLIDYDHDSNTYRVIAESDYTGA